MSAGVMRDTLSRGDDITRRAAAVMRLRALPCLFSLSPTDVCLKILLRAMHATAHAADAPRRPPVARATRVRASVVTRRLRCLLLPVALLCRDAHAMPRFFFFPSVLIVSLFHICLMII